MSETVLLTGAAGTIGTLLRQSLPRDGRHLRLLDVTPPRAPGPGEDVTVITGSFLDATLMREACRDVSAVVHLGGLSTGGYQWSDYLETNINGTHAVLEACRLAGVPRIVFASSNHAVGFHPRDRGLVPDYLFPRPDSFYGVSKAAGESLCSLYHDRHGLDAICLRIGTFRDEPNEPRTLWNWLSPGDCTRLFEAALSTPSPGFRVVWGVSANSRRVVSLEEARLIGYEPLDNAEDYLDQVLSHRSESENDLIGGPYADRDFE